jgi:hypothetical protein
MFSRGGGGLGYDRLPYNSKLKLYVVIDWFTCRAMMFGLRTIGHPIFTYKERHRKVLHNIYETNYTFFLLVFYLSFKLLSFQYAPSSPTCFNSTSFYNILFAIRFIVATYMTNTKEINSNKFIYDCPNID